MPKSISTCALLAAALLLSNSGCDRKVIMTVGLPSIIGAVLVDSGAGGVNTQAHVDVDGTRLLPVVAVNNDTLTLRDYGSTGEYMWTSSWQGFELRLAPGDPCALHVYQSDGEATTDTVVIPHLPKVVSPDTNFVLGKNQSLSVAWVATEGVDRYELAFDVHYRYYHGGYTTFSMDTTVLVPAGTSTYTLPGAAIFPSDVDSLIEGYCIITVTAETGPNIGSESKGNVNGKGCGYFFASGTQESWCFIGGYPSMDVPCPRLARPTAEQLVERKRALIGRMGQSLKVQSPFSRED